MSDAGANALAVLAEGSDWAPNAGRGVDHLWHCNGSNREAVSIGHRNGLSISLGG